MPALVMMVTNAGLDLIVDAQNGAIDAVEITQLGLSATPFVMAPTLTALPHEFRRLDTVAGQAVAANMIHVTAYDPAAVTYNVTGLGLFASDGTLVAVYSVGTGAGPVLSKAALATSLIAIDMVIDGAMAAVIEFGNALFSNPPATETVMGVARIATNAQTDAGLNDSTIMTPAKTRRMLAALLPVGMIIMWSGTVASIPAGWRLCDGGGGTPDLRDRFVVGAGGALNPAQTGGAASHDHGGSTAAHALTEAQMPAHRHLSTVPGTVTGALTAGNSISEVSNSGGDQEYSLDGAAAEPSIGRTSATGGGEAHSHGIAPAGNLPPYFALAFIMKV